MTPLFRLDSPDGLLAQLGESLKRRIERREYDVALVIGARPEIVEFIDRYGVRCVSFASPGHFIVELSGGDFVNIGLAALCDAGCKSVSVKGSTDRTTLDHAASFLLSRGVGFAPSSYGEPERLWNLPGEDHVDRINLGYESACRTFVGDRRLWPDGVLVFFDSYAQGFIMGMQRAGLTPGKDVIVATHVNRPSSFLLGLEDQTIRIEQDIKQIAVALVSATVAVLNGQKPHEDGWDSAIEISGEGIDSSVLFLKPDLQPSFVFAHSR